MSRIRTLLLLVGLFRTESLSAESPSTGLTLEAITQQFLADAPRARVARARVDQAAAAVAEAARLPNPALELQHNQAGGSAEQTASMSITLPLSGRRSARVGAARANVRGATADANSELAHLVVQLQRTFFTLVYTSQQRAQLSHLLEEVSRLETVARRRAERGQISGFDSLRLQSEGDLLRSQAAALEVEETRARAALQALLGSPEPVVVSGRIQDSVALPNAESLIEQASQQGAIAAAQARIAQSQLLLKASRREAFPEPTLQGGLWQVQEGTAENLGFTTGISFPLPLLDRGQAGSAVARADLRVLEAEVQALQGELRARITGGLEAAQKAKVRAQTFETEGLARAEQALRQAGLAYEAGEIGLTTLMETLRAAQNAREHALEAHFEARMSELEVQEAAGFLSGEQIRSGGTP